MVEKQVSLEELLCAEKPEKLIETLSFEEGIALLEELVEKVESGSLPLEESVQSYEKGTLLVGKLRALLEGAEKKVKLLKESGLSKTNSKQGKK